VRDKLFISAISALLLTGALTAGQAPQTAPRPASDPPAATTQQTPTTLVGCLYVDGGARTAAGYLQTG